VDVGSIALSGGESVMAWSTESVCVSAPGDHPVILIRTRSLADTCDGCCLFGHQGADPVSWRSLPEALLRHSISCRVWLPSSDALISLMPGRAELQSRRDLGVR